MVATSVAEEGLDIRQCNVVIRFDLAKTVLAYIQSRGRARKPGSDYILMVERYMTVLTVVSFFSVVIQVYFSRDLVSLRNGISLAVNLLCLSSGFLLPFMTCCYLTSGFRILKSWPALMTLALSLLIE